MTLRYTTYHFPGGIHPPERKTLSNAASIRTAALPSHLIIPLSQHIGLEAKPLVQVGQTVLRGQCIGLAQGATSANVHASSSGTVVAIEPRPTHHPSGLPTTCVVIKTDGLDAWAPHGEPNAQHALPWTSDPELLQQRLREAGIVGLGGAGFPTAVKASAHHNGELHTLILNAVECEPYITADDATLRYHAQEVLTGCDWLCRITGIRHVMIGIEDNKPEAITTLEKAIAEHHIAQNNVAQNNIEHENPIVYDIVVVPTKYPSGGEKQLIQLLTGREVPRGTLPAALGILCQNVGTAFAVYRALSLGTPLTSRITTLTGEAIPEAARGNYDVRLGTPITEWLNSVDVTWQHVDRLVMGGPMMGVTLPSADTPIVKVSNCVIAAPFSELPEPEPELPCIRCGLCAEACPASLLPQQLFWHAKSSNLDGLTQHNLSDCIECGACAYVCPSHIPLVQYYRYGKGLLRAHQESTRKSDQSRERFEARQARIDRENAEREAKRQARSKRAIPEKVKNDKNNASTEQSVAPKTPPPTIPPQHTAEMPSAVPEPNPVVELKNAYLKAEKKWKDAQRALDHLKKDAREKDARQKESLQTEQPPETHAHEAQEWAARIEKHHRKVAALKTTAEDLKAQWQAHMHGTHTHGTATINNEQPPTTNEETR